MLRRDPRSPRIPATAAVLAVVGASGILALTACAGSPDPGPAPGTVAPTLAFEKERLGNLYRAALAQGEHLGATGWRSAGWVQTDHTTSRTWCTGGSGDASTCTGLADADGTHAQSAYQITVELTTAGGATPGGLGVDIAFRSTQAPARLIRYRETGYASAVPAGFSAAVVVPAEPTRTTRHTAKPTTTPTTAPTTATASPSASATTSATTSSTDSPSNVPTAGPGELVVFVTETPSYQPTYVDPAGAHTAIGTPQGLGSTVVPTKQLTTFTSSAESLVRRMDSRLSDLYAETRYLLKIKNSDQGICAVDGMPNCPPNKLTTAERNSAFADLDDWYNGQRRALRTHSGEILSAINGAVDWSAFVSP